MPATTEFDAKRLLGREPERLTIEERFATAGKWIAMEIYSPSTLPLRRIEAIGDSVDECSRQLRERGLDPRNYEFSLLEPPY
jgi:hypothetical protein